MHESKPMRKPLGYCTKLLIVQAPSTEDERRKIKTTPYAN